MSCLGIIHSQNNLINFIQFRSSDFHVNPTFLSVAHNAVLSPASLCANVFIIIFFLLHVWRNAHTTVKSLHILKGDSSSRLVLLMTTHVLIIYLCIMKAIVRVIKLHQRHVLKHLAFPHYSLWGWEVHRNHLEFLLGKWKRILKRIRRVLLCLKQYLGPKRPEGLEVGHRIQIQAITHNPFKQRPL